VTRHSQSPWFVTEPRVLDQSTPDAHGALWRGVHEGLGHRRRARNLRTTFFSSGWSTEAQPSANVFISLKTNDACLAGADLARRSRGGRTNNLRGCRGWSLLRVPSAGRGERWSMTRGDRSLARRSPYRGRGGQYAPLPRERGVHARHRSPRTPVRTALDERLHRMRGAASWPPARPRRTRGHPGRVGRPFTVPTEAVSCRWVRLALPRWRSRGRANAGPVRRAHQRGGGREAVRRQHPSGG
jgi:hypothetical protein